MNLSEKEISYTSTNTYAVLNELTDKTKNVWLVFHGMGYLSRYFLKYFESLNSEDNYFIAPQAPSKYYIGPKYRHVGASWLTKENTKKETKNVMNYVESLLQHENLPSNKNLIVLGYSQGVSIAMRYLALNQMNCSQLIIHSGGIPVELNQDDFKYYNGKVSLIYGTQDEYLNEDRIKHEVEKAKSLFNDKLSVIPFDGKHVVNTDVIKRLI
ncbi:alpha/beta hydrolase [Hanstruepera marina]|uniref:alpha/beta hydrolase n=1 Tax=Hanstruepera marina TaxID=2873265 RepID=UPI001CA65186|nr:esterase [Hanstruepera marina]